MNTFIIGLLVDKIALPALRSGLLFAVKKLSKMDKGLTKDVSLAILTPIVDSLDNPIDGQDVIHLVKKLR